MLQTIILLTSETEAPHLSEDLKRYNPDLSVVAATSVSTLEAAVDCAISRQENFRLIAFCTDIIIPAALIERLPSPAYNFHAAPPSFPGSCAANFAIYEGAERFGVTAHEIASEVDTGRIVATRMFPVTPGMTASDLSSLAYRYLIDLFLQLAPHLATDMADLPPAGETWRGPARKRTDAERLGSLNDGLDEKETERRKRAFGRLIR